MTQYQNLNNILEDKTYFNAGDLVQLKLDLPNKPIMIVVRKETSIFKHDSKRSDRKSVLIGIRCRWFTADGALQEAIFSTKDLLLI